MDVKARPYAISKDGKTALVAGEPTPDAEPTGPLGIEPPDRALGEHRLADRHVELGRRLQSDHLHIH